MFEVYFLLGLTALLAGAINSIAGGGTLLTFPALFGALGTSAAASVLANGTSTVALIPGNLAALGGYRSEFHQVKRWAWLLAAPSLLGGLIGSLLVIWWPESFKTAVPWLILSAALLFALQPLVTRWTGIGRQPDLVTRRSMTGAVILQFFISIYGGYFGAGVGILMLTSLGLMGLHDIHEMNALKVLLGTIINSTAVVVFIANDNVHWPYAIFMGLLSTVGGYFGARVARRLNRQFIRWLVIVIGVGLATFYFWQELT